MNSRVEQPTTRTNHRVYLGITLICAAVAVIGFARTFYIRWMFDSPPDFKWLFNKPPLSALSYLHGFLISGWFALVFTQIILVVSRRVRLHRRLGVAGIYLAAAIIVVAFAVVYLTARKQPSNPAVLTVFGADLFILTVFGGLVTGAVLMRTRREWHARLMILASISLLGPALIRIDLQFIHSNGPFFTLAFADLLILICAAFDFHKLRRVHPAFLWGGLPIVAGYPVFFFSATLGPWHHLAGRLVSWP